MRVHGGGGRFPTRQASLFLGNAGTAVRPLTAALAMLGGDYEIRGVPRMHERPIADLVDPLVALGCAIRYLGKHGYPPLAIGEGRARAGVPVTVRGDVSSQFLTALLMALPLASGADRYPTTIKVTTPLISRPYVDDHDEPDAAFRRRCREPRCVDVHRARGRALCESGDAASRG